MTDITVSNITDGTLEGTGVFDKLMQATNAHIHNEYRKNRITATDYSTVYLGAIQAVMNTSLQFILQEQQSEAQADLLKQQKLNLIDDLATNAVQRSNIEAQTTKLAGVDTANVAAQTSLTTAQETKLSGVDTANVQAQTSLTTAQETKLAGVDTTLVEKQTLKVIEETVGVTANNLNIPKQGIILDSQNANLVSENKVIELQDEKLVAETAGINANTLNIPKQGSLLDAQTANAVSENAVIELQDDKLTQEIANLAQQVLKSQAEITNLTKQGTVLDQTILKSQEEVLLLAAKVITENAQTQNITTGVLGKQQTLYAKQTDGFDRDAEQKASKIVVDAFAVQRSTDESLTPPTSLDGTSINSVVEKMKTGINA